MTDSPPRPAGRRQHVSADVAPELHLVDESDDE
jgi:hypothetical protein